MSATKQSLVNSQYTPPGPVAYFCMEIAVDPAAPTYSGGLGVLAGDTLHSAADLGFPMVAVTLLYHKGYFRQHLDAHGHQDELPVVWSPEKFFEKVDARCSVEIEGRTIHIGAWRFRFRGTDGFEVPVYLLDTDLAENEIEDRFLTAWLYGGDRRY